MIQLHASSNLFFSIDLKTVVITSFFIDFIDLIFESKYQISNFNTLRLISKIYSKNTNMNEKYLIVDKRFLNDFKTFINNY